MVDDSVQQLVGAARRYRAAFYAFQAAVTAYQEHGEGRTRRHLDEAEAALSAAQEALFGAALASDDAAVLLPEDDVAPEGPDIAPQDAEVAEPEDLSGIHRLVPSWDQSRRT
jgi:hypothetical protein